MKYEKQITEWVRLYLDYINKITVEVHVKQEEGYKFVSVDNFIKNFDVTAIDLRANLDLALPTNNLTVGSMYYPKKMLLMFAEKFPEETRQALQTLYDKTISITERLNKAEKKFAEIMKMMNPEGKASSYMSLRFLSLLLGFRYPDECNALKPNEWKVFCKKLDQDFNIPNKIAAGDRYNTYEPYIEELRKYVSLKPEIKRIKDALVHDLVFKDDNFRWITQDIIYIGARLSSQNASNLIDLDNIIEKTSTSSENIVNEIDYVDSDSGSGWVSLEKHLEDFIVKNWDGIPFGEKLSLFVSDEGSGQQYTTDVGIIDLLALDESGNFVVIELKRWGEKHSPLGQIMSYMGWVKDNLATAGQNVRGIIIVGKAEKQLIAAMRVAPPSITLKEYKLNLVLTNIA